MTKKIESKNYNDFSRRRVKIVENIYIHLILTMFLSGKIVDRRRRDKTAERI